MNEHKPYIHREAVASTTEHLWIDAQCSSRGKTERQWSGVCCKSRSVFNDMVEIKKERWYCGQLFKLPLTLRDDPSPWDAVFVTQWF